MLLTREALILVFTLSGISLKLADIYGERGRGYVFSVVSAVGMGTLISDSPLSSSMVLGIIVGVVLAGKVDRPNLVVGLGLTLVVSAVLGFNIPDFALLAIIALAALIDEVGHDRVTSRGILGKFFRIRMVLKAVVVVLTVLGLIDVIHCAGFLSFDVVYEVTNTVWFCGKKEKS